MKKWLLWLCLCPVYLWLALPFAVQHAPWHAEMEAHDRLVQARRSELLKPFLADPEKYRAQLRDISIKLSSASSLTPAQWGPDRDFITTTILMSGWAVDAGEERSIMEEIPKQAHAVLHYGNSLCHGEIPSYIDPTKENDMPSGGIYGIMAMLYVAVVPCAFSFLCLLVIGKQCRISEQWILMVFASFFWPTLFSETYRYDPIEVAEAYRDAWLKRASSRIKAKVVDQIYRFLDQHRHYTLDQLMSEFGDLAQAVGLCRRSRLQRITVVAGVFFVLLRPNMTPARAQEIKVVSQSVEELNGGPHVVTSTPGITYVPEHSAVAVSGLPERIELSWKNTVASLIGRELRETDTHADWSGKMGFRLVQLRTSVTVGNNWGSTIWVDFTDPVRLSTATLDYHGEVLDSPVDVRVGRQFLPTLTSMATPPWVMMFDLNLTDKLTPFYGDGVSASIRPLDSIKLTAKAFRPVDETGLPDYFVGAVQYSPASFVTFGGLTQVGTNPDKDWQLAGETLFRFRDWYSENLVVIRESPDSVFRYGTHNNVSCELTPRWGAGLQFDWLRTHDDFHKKPPINEYKPSATVWYRPRTWIKLQAEAAYDWLQGGGQQHQLVELKLGLVVHF